MKHFVQSLGYARIRFINGIVFILLGLFVLVHSFQTVGFRFAAFSLAAYVLPLAFIALGVVRMRMGWPKP